MPNRASQQGKVITMTMTRVDNFVKTTARRPLRWILLSAAASLAFAGFASPASAAAGLNHSTVKSSAIDRFTLDLIAGEYPVTVSGSSFDVIYNLNHRGQILQLSLPTGNFKLTVNTGKVTVT